MKYVLVDMDGTICDFHDPVNNRISMTEFPEGFFRNKIALVPIINMINTVYKNDYKIIFSQSPNENTDKEKEEWLQNNGIDWVHIFLRYPNIDKAQALWNFMQRNNLEPSQIVVIDDDINVLRKCEKLHVTCVHPSHLLALVLSSTTK